MAEDPFVLRLVVTEDETKPRTLKHAINIAGNADVVVAALMVARKALTQAWAEVESSINEQLIEQERST